MTSGRRVTLRYLEWRWNSEKLPNSISSNKRLFKISAKGGAGGMRSLEGWRLIEGGACWSPFLSLKVFQIIKQNCETESNIPRRWNQIEIVKKKERYITHRLSPSINRPCERDKLINICRLTFIDRRTTTQQIQGIQYLLISRRVLTSFESWKWKWKGNMHFASCRLHVFRYRIKFSSLHLNLFFNKLFNPVFEKRSIFLREIRVS